MPYITVFIDDDEAIEACPKCGPDADIDKYLEEQKAPSFRETLVSLLEVLPELMDPGASNNTPEYKAYELYWQLKRSLDK